MCRGWQTMEEQRVMFVLQLLCQEETQKLQSQKRGELEENRGKAICV